MLMYPELPSQRSTREAIASHFEQADLTKRKNFLNQSIDAILQGENTIETFCLN